MNRLFMVCCMAFIFAFALENYSFAEPVPPCICDNISVEMPTNLTGSEILDILCPGGEPAEDTSVIFEPSRITISSPDPEKTYHVVDDGGSSYACEISYDNSGVGLSITESQYESCRRHLVNSCGLLVRSVPAVSEWGLIAIAGLIGIIGLYAVNRKRARA